MLFDKWKIGWYCGCFQEHLKFPSKLLLETYKIVSKFDEIDSIDSVEEMNDSDYWILVFLGNSKHAVIKYSF